ncbi:hypothetical protein [Kitasatospora camelliae]|uniref:Uncharacterized protein n=1 Tax=Kitasatospora camelliae TaxID=3156397 RepID=A0AAU8K858_9ACTN
MRLVFVCQQCGAHYFPPAGLVYPDGGRASAVWCSWCQVEAADRGVAEPAGLAAMAMILAVRAMEAAVAARPRPGTADPRSDRRPSRPARTGRGQLRPNGARSRLG